MSSAWVIIISTKSLVVVRYRIQDLEYQRCDGKKKELSGKRHSRRGSGLFVGLLTAVPKKTRARRGKTMQRRVMTSSVALLRQTNQARMQESS